MPCAGIAARGCATGSRREFAWQALAWLRPARWAPVEFGCPCSKKPFWPDPHAPFDDPAVLGPLPHWLTAATDRAHGESETRSGQCLRDPFLSHRRAQRLQLPHDMAYELRQAVHGFGSLEERVPTALVGSPHAGRKGCRPEQEPSRSFWPRPSTRRPELEDRQALGGSIVRPTPGLDAAHAKVLDFDLPPKERERVERRGHSSCARAPSGSRRRGRKHR
jgi:hypothetical protein